MGAMAVLKKIERVMIKCFTVTTGILLILTISNVILAVLDRTFFRIGLSWTEELARTCFIWFSMFAPAIMITSGTQFSCTYFIEKVLSPRKMIILNIIINIIALVVLAILVYNGFKYVHIMRRQQMPSIHAPIAIMYLSLPVGLGAICIMTVIYIINLIHRFIHPEAEENKTGSLT